MKITINENLGISETEVIINCKQADANVIKLINQLKSIDNKLAVIKDEQTFILEPKNVLYFESIDKKTFVYCSDAVYETSLRLYELEDLLYAEGFVRAAKATVINLAQIRSLRPDFGARLIITLNNDEKIMASRQYAQEIKHRLGIK